MKEKDNSNCDQGYNSTLFVADSPTSKPTVDNWSPHLECSMNTPDLMYSINIVTNLGEVKETRIINDTCYNMYNFIKSNKYRAVMRTINRYRKDYLCVCTITQNLCST